VRIRRSLRLDGLIDQRDDRLARVAFFVVHFLSRAAFLAVAVFLAGAAFLAAARLGAARPGRVGGVVRTVSVPGAGTTVDSSADGHRTAKSIRSPR
jgi:hypothetical protein